MPEPVRDLLLGLEEDVRQVRLAPARDIRARGRSRARRRVALAAAGLALVAGVGGMSLVRLTGPPSQPAAPAPPPATASGSCPGLDLRLPDGPEQVAVRVFDGVGRIDAIGGRDDAVANDLRNRGFTQASAPGGGPGKTRPDAVATLRYGPRAVGKVGLLQAMLLNKADAQFDPGRTRADVDLVVGKGFQQFATPTELNQALVEAGEPTAPSECR